MDIKIYKHGDSLFVSVSGELDHHSANGFKEQLDREIDKGIFDKLILDMSQLKFMDSSGVGVILGRYNKMITKDGQVVICGMNDQVAKIAQLSGLQKILPVYNSIKEVKQNL